MVFDIRKSFLFYLDTKYRSAGSLTSPIFNFPNNLIGIENDERIRLTLQEMTIPYTFYQTELYNNKFLLTENGINRLVEIEIGNYNIVTFLLELTNKLNISAGLYTYVISYIAQTNRFKFIATPKPSIIIGSITFNFNRDSVFNITGIDIIESLNLEHKDFYRSMLPNHFKNLALNFDNAKFYDQSKLKEKIEERNFYSKSKTNCTKTSICVKKSVNF